MPKSIALIFVLTVAAFAQDSDTIASQARTETEVWNLEKAYWEFVKANDLEKYRALWHEDFIGWPSVSSEPVRKDHVTDWITTNTSKGIMLQSSSIEQLAMKITGDIAINHYRIKMNWASKDGTNARSNALRITHTWIRNHDSWQIIGGMSAPVNAEGR